MLKVYELHKDNFINERSGGYIIVYTLFNKYDRLVVNNAHSGKKMLKRRLMQVFEIKTLHARIIMTS